MANSTKISEYSTTAANNTSIDSIDIDENCAASGINNAIRSVLKHQADAFTQGTPIALDQTNNRVGIGTDLPDTSLHISAASSARLRLEDTTNNVKADILVGDTSSVIGNASNHDLAFMTNDINRMTIDSSGLVGIGTDTPTTYGDSNTKLAVVTPTSNANDVNIRFGTNDVKGIIFVNDVSGNGVGFGTTTDDHVQFNTNNTERMRIDSSGRLRLGGTFTGTFPGNDEQTFMLDGTMGLKADGDGVRFYRESNSSQVGAIAINTSSTSYNTSSDYRLKEAVVDMTGAIDRVKALAPKRFNFIADSDTTVDGFLAHEAQAVVPEAVTGTHNEVDDGGNPVMQGIDQSKLVPLLTAALKESIAKIETLETEMTALKARVTALEA